MGTIRDVPTLGGDATNSSGSGWIKLIKSGGTDFIPDSAGTITLGSAAGINAQKTINDVQANQLMLTGAGGVLTSGPFPIAAHTQFFSSDGGELGLTSSNGGFSVVLSEKVKFQLSIDNANRLKTRVSTIADPNDDKTPWTYYPLFPGLSSYTQNGVNLMVFDGHDAYGSASFELSSSTSSADFAGIRLKSYQGGLIIYPSNSNKEYNSTVVFTSDSISSKVEIHPEKTNITNNGNSSHVWKETWTAAIKSGKVIISLSDNKIDINTPLSVVGQIIPTNYDNFDDRYGGLTIVNIGVTVNALTAEKGDYYFGTGSILAMAPSGLIAMYNARLEVLIPGVCVTLTAYAHFDQSAGYAHAGSWSLIKDSSGLNYWSVIGPGEDSNQEASSTYTMVAPGAA